MHDTSLNWLHRWGLLMMIPSIRLFIYLVQFALLLCLSDLKMHLWGCLLDTGCPSSDLSSLLFSIAASICLGLLSSRCLNRDWSVRSWIWKASCPSLVLLFDRKACNKCYKKQSPSSFLPNLYSSLNTVGHHAISSYYRHHEPSGSSRSACSKISSNVSPRSLLTPTLRPSSHPPHRLGYCRSSRSEHYVYHACRSQRVFSGQCCSSTIYSTGTFKHKCAWASELGRYLAGTSQARYLGSSLAAAFCCRMGLCSQLYDLE